MTSKRAFLLLSALAAVLLAATPAGASDPGAGGGVVAPASEVEAPSVPQAEAAQTETTPTTPGGEEQPGDQPTETDTTPDGGPGPVDGIPEDGTGGESAGGLPRTCIEVAGLAMIGLGLLMAGLALRPTSSWPPPRDRLSRSIRPR
jgi:hypothetical protein